LPVSQQPEENYLKAVEVERDPIMRFPAEQKMSAFYISLVLPIMQKRSVLFSTQAGNLIPAVIPSSLQPIWFEDGAEDQKKPEENCQGGKDKLLKPV
jgi:hypothetical protein